ncbi:hypothetical protein NC652_014903 [Populus alba x Populus x berolinensis]|nr:hypothetical protein NC652_014903 [Populus alba x Populus x berolinensis]
MVEQLKKEPERGTRAYIREEQREVRGKFGEIREEAAKLKEETNLISQQSAANQLRLDLVLKDLDDVAWRRFAGR